MLAHRTRYRNSDVGRAWATQYEAQEGRREAGKARRKAFYQTDEGKRYQQVRDIWLAWKKTPEEYAEIISHGPELGCKICGDKSPKTGFVLDHDHSCCPTPRTCGNCIRGVLCRNCNAAIGLLKDNPSTLLAAAAYLNPPSAGMLVAHVEASRTLAVA